MTMPNLSKTWQYGLAVLSVGVALAASLILRPLIAPIPSIFFFMAVVIAAWFGGVGAALLAAALSTASVAYFSIEPIGSSPLAGDNLVRAAMFFVVAVLCALFGNVRRHAVTRALRSAELLTVALSSIGDAVLVTDTSGAVTFMNGVASDLTGWDASAAIGRPLSEVFDIVNERTRARVDSPCEHVMKTGRIVGLANHTILIARDGREIPVEDSGAPIRDELGNMVGVVLVFRDASARRRQETERERSLERESSARAETELAQQRFAYLAEASEQLSSSQMKDAEDRLQVRAMKQTALAALGQRALAEPDLEVLFQDALRTVSETIDVPLIKILELSADGQYLVLHSAFGFSPGLVGVARVEAGLNTQAGYTLKRRTSVVVNDFATESRFRGAQLLHDNGVVSGMTVTIGIGDHPYGILGAHSRQKREFSDTDATFLESVANIVALSIIRRRAEESLESQREWLRVTLASIGDAVIATDTSGDITFMNLIASRLTGWGVDEVEGVRLDDVFHIINESTRKVSRNPVHAALEHGHVVGLANHTVMIARDGTEIPIDDSAAPIRGADGSVQGVVLVFHDVTERRKAEAERAVAEHRLQIQFEISLLLADSKSIDVAAHRVLEAIGNFLEFDLGAVWAFDHEREALVFVDAWDKGDGSAEHYRAASHNVALRSGERLAGRVLSERAPVFTTDGVAAGVDLPGKDLESGGWASEFAFPVMLGNEMHGVFEFFSRELVESQDAVVETLAAVGRQIAQFMERLRAEHALRGSEERYRTVAETASDAIVIVDEFSTILFANRAVEKVFGYSKEQLIGSDLRNLMPEYLRLVNDRAVADNGGAGTLISNWNGSELVGNHLDGRAIPLEISFGEFFRDGRQFFTGIVRDISERKQSQLELKLAMERAEAANVAKDRFLAVLSHELRTPLTPVLTLAQHLEHAADPPQDLKPIFTMIRRNIELEARLIDDLLDLTRISRGKLHLQMERVDAHSLLTNVVAICREELDTKQQHLEVHFEAGDHFATADPARLQQVFWNLLQNAVKFTPEGGRISIGTSNPEPGSLRVTVTDSGIGLEPDQLQRVFNAFEQAEQSISRRFGGLGLGLSISSSIVEMLGGTISAASNGRSKGAMFTVNLPTASTDVKSSVANVADSASARELTRRRILLVDDHVDTSSVMKLLLERRGYDVETAGDMSNALALVDEHEYDLLISDIGLPDGSGLELMKRIHAVKSLPGIALSGFGMEDDIRRSHEAGFSEHLIKPVNFQALQDAIRRVMG